MAWSYRKRIKIIPGVHLNLSRKGISTSIGFRGASVTFGRNGTYLNTGIPGTGLHNRQKISPEQHTLPTPPSPDRTEVPPDNIFSANIQQVTSQDMQGIKEAILTAHDQRMDLKRDLLRIRVSLFISNIKLIALYVFAFGFLVKSLNTIRKECADKKVAIEGLLSQIENSRVTLDVEFESGMGDLYDKVVRAFKTLTYSQKIWDVTGAYANDRVATRSAASTLIKTTLVRFGIKNLEDVRSAHEPLWMKNANGADLYFYPGFIVMFSNRRKFALVGMNELQIVHRDVSYVERASVPSDAKIIDRTWAKVNKNGTPDRRFKENYQIPVVRYGALLLMTETGVHEEYMFSNYEASESFAHAFETYLHAIQNLKPMAVME